MDEIKLPDGVEKLFELEWTFAKSMPTIPHWYLVSSTCKEPELFTAFCEFIEKYGKIERFYSKKYKYFYYGDYKYWWLGDFVTDPPVILNRAKV